MCFPAIVAAATSLFSAGTAAVSGAAATAASTGFTWGQALSIGGTALSAGGALMQGQQTAAAARANARYAEAQSATERQLAGIEDERTRERMRSAIAQQRSQLIARGLSLDSPTAVLLGRRAAQEMSFASQSVRAGAAARTAELGAEARSWRGRATTALLTGRLSAASSLLSRAPDMWPGLADRKVLS